MKRKGLLGKLARASVVGVAGVAMMLSFSAPAHAASSISTTLTIYNTYEGAPRYLWHVGQVNVYLPMSQQDAEGYIWNGARIEVTCWGDDTFSDDDLFSPNTRTYTGATGDSYGDRLIAYSGGVFLQARVRAPHHASLTGGYNGGGGFDEDSFPGQQDEIFCKSTWVDGDGARLASFTQVVKGDF